MVRMFLHIMAVAILLLLSSCEEVINIPLNNVTPVVVIEGTVTNLPGPYTIKISQTTDYFNPGNIAGLSGALVFLKDYNGHQWQFKEQRPGYYQNNEFPGTPGVSYTLHVQLMGMEYEATSTMQQPVSIDSLEVQYFPGTHFAKAGYFIFIYFTDPSARGNYYRIKMYKGSRPNPVIQLLDDKLTNGKRIKYFLYGGSYQPGDTAVVELQSIDCAVFNYFLTLSNVAASNQSGATSTPANPNTNFSGGALGYFGALAISRDTLIIPKR